MLAGPSSGGRRGRGTRAGRGACWGRLRASKAEIHILTRECAADAGRGPLERRGGGDTHACAVPSALLAFS